MSCHQRAIALAARGARAACAALLLGLCVASHAWAVDSWQGVEKVVAIGDLHGDYDNFLKVLKQAGVVSRWGNWQAGKTHLVQLGDVPDRGPDTGKIIALLQKLQKQAEKDGGAVHALIGNHEAMNMQGDLRYVDPGEYKAFVTANSPRLRDRYYQLVIEHRKQADPEFEPDADFRAQWEQQIPLGYVEHRLAWAPGGEYGSWVLQHNAIIRIDRTLFLHGGLSPAVAGMPLEQINREVHAELAKGETGRADPPGMASDPNGPLWYRGLADHDEATEQANVDAILAWYDVDRIVVGHTPGFGTIVPRFGGKVLVADSGISHHYGGHLASLTIEGGRLVNTQEGQPLVIPVGDADPLPYFRAVEQLEPGVGALERLIDSLQHPAPAATGPPPAEAQPRAAP